MTAKKLGGLGRGLGAIYDDFDVSGLSEEDGDDKRLETVKLDELRPGSTQPRSTMTEEGLQELADSIRQQGIISPIADVDVFSFDVPMGQTATLVASTATEPVVVAVSPSSSVTTSVTT